MACSRSLRWLFLLLNDAQSPLVDSAKTWLVLQVLKFLLAAFLIPMALYLALGLLLKPAPLSAAQAAGITAMAFSRWLAFGWAGSIGVLQITAETCPLGDASITRLASPSMP